MDLICLVAVKMGVKNFHNEHTYSRASMNSSHYCPMHRRSHLYRDGHFHNECTVCADQCCDVRFHNANTAYAH